MTRKGIPAAAVLAGGISRHGSSCSCPYCVKPVIPSAYATPIKTGPLPATAMDEAFSKARETIAELEAKRVEHVGGEWSPSQHVRAS